jgi:signal transduction histidine kinase
MVRVEPGEYTGVPVFALGVGLMLLSVGYLAFVGVSPLNVGKAGVPFLLASTLLNTGRYVSVNEFTLWQSLKVATWGAGTMLGAGWMAVVILFILLVDGVVVEDSLFIFLTSMSAGAAAGAALGTSKMQLAVERERLQRQSERTARLNHRLRVINRVLRHNFQNRINVLRLWTERVTEEVETDLVVDYSDTITATVDRLEELTEKTREFEAVNQYDAQVEFDLDSLVEQRLSAVEADHPELTTLTDLEVEATVLAHGMLETAIDEMLENAVEHNDPSAIQLGVRTRTDEERGEAVLKVADTGSGIPEDERAAVEAGDETPLIHGSGMGMWLMQAIVAESDGEFTIWSNQPSGTVIEIRVPLAHAAASRSVERVDGTDASTATG